MYAAAYLLETFGCELKVDQQELEDFAVSIAEGGVESGDLALWFERRSSEM